MGKILDALLYPLRALFAAPGQIFSTGRRLFGLSLPARVALLVGFLLVVCVAVSFLTFSFATGRPFWGSLLQQPYYLSAIAVLVVLIPIIVYHVIRLWLEGDVSPFSDIDKAWNAGQAELERQGIDLAQVPIFLILGSAGEEQEKSLFDASRLGFNVREFPLGPSALHWYVNPDSIYVTLTRVGCSSRLAALGKAAAMDEKARPATSADRPPADNLRGTIVTGMQREPARRDPRESAVAAPWSPPAGMDALSGTMMVSPGMALPGRPVLDGSGAGSEGRAITLPQDDAVEEERRMEYFCQLLHRARQPICPANGVLTLLPYGLICRGQREAGAVQQAVARDLGAISRILKIRCPVTAMVVGMEEESGFRELVRRVGRDRAAQNRFGKGFEVANPPIPERLAPLCAHACGSFEDWVYLLFREKGSLSRPGNTKLYALLCKIRHDVQSRLESILVNAFGSDPEQDPRIEPLFFSGCYFAAVGETEDRQAFVKGVLEKLPKEQGELQWTKAARKQEQVYQGLAQFLFAIDFLLLVSVVGMIAYKVWWK
jgi:hypothetical protein